jgi:DNA-binding transcriptional MerR regulator/methylmalonyl-CoA mutase cobalamin-binding subunit
MNKKPEHTIKAVALKTGLTPHVIRAWERRYRAVSPRRSDTGRRLYSDEDIERLSLLHKATGQGESIGQIANMSIDELNRLVEGSSEKPGYKSDTRPPANEKPPSYYVDACLQAAKDVDQKKLEVLLMKAAVNFSQPVFLEQVIEPLVYKTGDFWQSGEFKVLHEHIVSAIVRTVLGSMLNAQNAPERAPVMVATTPAGQIHEFGALLAAVTAASDGWRVVYLGPSMPADDIANAVRHQGAVVVALSVVYPGDDPALGQELVKLRKYMGGDINILVGGRAAKYYRNAFDATGSIYVESLEDLRLKLGKIRNSFSL